MNAVEIEEAISALAEQAVDAAEFPFAFLQAFGNKETTIKRLRKGESNKSDLGGVLQTNNIHIAVATPGEVTKTLAALKASPATARAKAKFVLATDGDTFEAEDLASGETVACAYADFPDHLGFFLPLAGITTVKQVRESSFDIRATSRLNRLYVELLKDNPEWGTAERRPDMNHFMARLLVYEGRAPIPWARARLPIARMAKAASSVASASLRYFAINFGLLRYLGVSKAVALDICSPPSRLSALFDPRRSPSFVPRFNLRFPQCMSLRDESNSRSTFRFNADFTGPPCGDQIPMLRL
jgi:hypothetical protein